MEKLILTLDLGTTCVKISLFSEELNLLACVTEEYSITTYPDGRVELDPSRWIMAIKEGIALVKKRIKGEIVAISTTTQGETIIPVDKNGKPLYPAVVWLDSRATAQADYLASRIDLDTFYAKTGLPEISGALPIAKMMWFRDEKPEIYENTKCFLLAEDYIIHWLTGQYASEKSLQCSTGWFDIQNDCVWDDIMEIAKLDKRKLPKMLPCGISAGGILKERILDLGLSPRCIAVTSAMDQTAAALGAGCTEEGIITETTGTALVLAAFTKSPSLSVETGITVYRHAIDGAYLYLPIGNTAGMALKWLRDNFFEGVSYAQLDSFAAEAPPCSDGLIMLPYLSGCVNPENVPDAKAVFAGATLSTTKAHFIRAVMEAISYQLKEFIKMLSDLGISAKEIRSLGGGSKSDLWQQIKANCCNIPFTSSQNSEATSYGAAMLAAQALFLPSASKANTSNKKDFLPDPVLTATYDAGYQAFSTLRNAILPLYKK